MTRIFNRPSTSNLKIKVAADFDASRPEPACINQRPAISFRSALHNLLTEPRKKKLQPSGIAFNGLSRFAKRIKHPILILCHFHGEKKSSPGCCAAAIGRYCMENMHNSHTEIIVITVKCPLMESHRVFELVEGLARASTVRCLCSF